MAATISAQHDNNWYFGRMAALNFNNGKPASVTGSTMSTMEGSASISDANGQVLFYTNGIDVWNRQNKKMPNGTGLLGDQSTTQAAVIVPKPGSQTRYYIFVADDAGGPNGLTYSEVDMAADAGKGDVVAKNIQLLTPVTEKITAAYHANGKDIWVTTHQWGSDAFYSYKVTSSGVSATPVISNTGLVIAGADNSGHYAGWMAVSPDGEHIAAASGLLAVELFDFNNATGKVSNGVVVKQPAKCYGVEFSPDSNLLYVTSNDQVLQYDVHAPNVAATELAVGTVEVASSIKLGPDSKIYVVNKYLAKTMSVINKPNVKGMGCNYVLNGVDLGGSETYVGLPNFLTTPYYILKIKAESDCKDTEMVFSAEGTLDADSIVWDFGDGNHSNSLVAVHTYAATGTYTVKAKAKKNGLTRYYSQQVTVVSAPKAYKAADMLTCGTPEGTAVFNLKTQDNTILGSQPTDMFTVTYYSSYHDAMHLQNAHPTGYTNVSNPETVFARVSRNGTDCYDITSFDLSVSPSPVLEMDELYSFCEDSYVVVEAPQGFDSYTWSYNGTSVNGGFQKSINRAGEYTLTVTRTTGGITCDATVMFTVMESQKPVISKIEVADWTDNKNSINIVTATTGNYEYSIDGTVFQDSPLFENLSPGKYEITVRDKGGCGFAEDEAFLLNYPKYFTPNGDGVHDTWRIENAFFAEKLSVTIYDRYGRVMAAFTGSSAGWDGTYNGSPVAADDYWFVVTRANGKEYKGHFAMMR